MKRTLSFVGAALTVGVLLLPASPADAAFPGANGDLVFARFTHGQNDLWALDPLTSALTRLTDSPHRNEASPTGTRTARRSRSPAARHRSSATATSG